MTARFENKVAIVTGAAGGIGRAVAVRLARDGAKVLASDLKDAPIDETAAAVEAAGGEVATAAHDVTRWDDWQRVISEATSRFGGVDFLVNNAGIEGQVASIEDGSPEVFDQVMAVNVKGVFLGIKAAIPEMRKRGGGSIVNLASVAGLIGEAVIAPYVASKHAVLGLTKSAAVGYGPEGIRINAVCPSPIETRMMRALETGVAPGNETDVKEAFEQRIPLRRYGTPDEVAAVIAFLCSDDARFVSGSSYTVDGGMTFH
jgi:NAD(P)-dependent dehydrogenase (short-subunit alcohol dehydrogenase family)